MSSLRRNRTPSPPESAYRPNSSQPASLRFTKKARVTPANENAADVEMDNSSGPRLQLNNLDVERHAQDDRRRRSRTPTRRKSTPGSPRRTNSDALQTAAAPPERTDGRLSSGSRSQATNHLPPYIVPALPTGSSQDALAEHRHMSWARGMAHPFNDQHTHCVIALNVGWVPRLVVGQVDVILRADGRFGVEDPLNWPQFYSHIRPYLALIPKMPRPSHWAVALWETPGQQNFVRANDNPDSEAFGYLISARLATLRGIVDKLDELVEAFGLAWSKDPSVFDELRRLQAATQNALTMFAIPSTYRDLVRQWGRLHRCWVECWAFIRWHDGFRHRSESTPVSDRTLIPLERGLDGTGVMGAVCSDPTTAQKLFAAGVPVWYLLRSHVVGSLQTEARNPVEFTEPDNVETSHNLGGVRCRAVAGDPHLTAISRESEAVMDIEHVPLPAAFGLGLDEDEDDTVRSHGARRKQASQRVRALARFDARTHDLLPPRLDVWQQALQSLDKTQRCESRVGLWLPEPELVVTPENKLRLLVYISNWVTIRINLLSKLGRRSLYEAVSPNSWRTFLERFPEMTEEEREVSEEKRRTYEAHKACAKSGQASQPLAPKAGSNPASGSGSGSRAKGGGKGGGGSEGKGGSSFGVVKESETTKQAAQKRHNQKEEVCKYFTALLGRESRPFTLRTDPIRSFAWRGWRVALDLSAAKGRELPLPADVAREIAWELADVAFRVELCELDRRTVSQDGAGAFRRRSKLLSVIFPGVHWSRPELPPSREGLHARDIRDRSGSLEGLRQLLCRWEGCPQEFLELRLDAKTSVDDLAEFERKAAAFYCQIAYQKLGRAAAVPRAIPVSFDRMLDSAGLCLISA